MNMLGMLVDGKIFLDRQKDELREAFLDETGAVDIVAIVVMIGIAVILAVVFRNQISGLIETLVGNITGKANDAIDGK